MRRAPTSTESSRSKDAPTGRRAEVQLIDIMRFDHAGLISEHWGVADMLSLLQQLGAIPAGPPPPAGPPAAAETARTSA
ncbi:ester cyclase [Pseudolysinimonas sp.]|uniref:ester cyclase n=1 Tax=Pseudolysinimonas sp. TaxID=2680009 RepID=UPI003F802A67